MTNKGKFRLSAWVDRETFEKLLDMQMNERVKQGRKVSQGEIIEQLIKGGKSFE